MLLIVGFLAFICSTDTPQAEVAQRQQKSIEFAIK